MKVSLHIVKQLIGTELPAIDELAERINTRLGGIEAIEDLGEKYKDAKIVRVVECEKHPNADKLSVCKIDDGSGELVQVVCGAPNARAGMLAVWLPPASTVPSTFGTSEPFVLGARELRGVMSSGMLASAAELAIGDDHSGIIDITESDMPEGVEFDSLVGQSFAGVFGLDDYVVEIENKMFTHRPDLFGQLGVAREIAGIHHQKFIEPAWYSMRQRFTPGSGVSLQVFNDTPEKSPRFMSVALSGAAVGPSPLWLQCALVAMGSKPINNIVDVTNYIMLMTAQPVHAYDYDKLRGQKLGVRMAKVGETVTLINGKTYDLDVDDIVIVDGEGPVGLAGIMGGSESEVTSETSTIVLEVANFDMYTVRKTSMRHGIFTDASTRFSKGQSQWQNSAVMAELIRMVGVVSGTSVASEVFDWPNMSTDEYENSTELFSVERVNDVLGADLSEVDIAKLLDNVSLQLYSLEPGEDDVHKVIVPFWRTDIATPEDIVEEVGRLYGFDRLPRALPLGEMRPAPENHVRETKQRVRESLVRAGANEVLTYSFVHENVLKRAEQDSAQAFKLSNALSPDLQYYRLTVLPSLLDKVHANIKTGHDEFTLFEIGKGHNKKYHAAADDGLPGEMNFVDFVYASKKPKDGASFFQVRRMLDHLANDLRAEFIYKPVTERLDYPVTAPFDLDRSAMVETTDGVFVGMIGELKQSVVRAFKLPEYTAAATLDLEGLVKIAAGSGRAYRPLSRYPSVSQDVSIKTSRDEPYGSLLAKVEGVLGDTEHDVTVQPVSVYQPKDSTDSKTTTFRLVFTSHDKTLSDKDVTPIVQRIEQLGS